jgi:hypothetical protein
MTLPPPVCMNCKHYRGARMCDAYPEKIVDLIWLEGNPHTKPVTGDHGIHFEERNANDPRPNRAR